MSTNKSVIDLQNEQEKVLRSLEALKESGTTSGEQWTKAYADFRSLDDQIESAKQSETVTKRLLGLQAEHEREEDQKPKREARDMSYEGVFKRFLTLPQNGRMPDEEQRILETRGTNTQITTTNSLGGYIVPQSFSGKLEMAGIWRGGMLEACETYPDDIGGTLKWPTGDDTGTNGMISGQGVARTVQDLTFGNVLFVDYTIDSGIVKVGRELINDQRVGFLEKALSMSIAERIRKKTNSVLTNGTGTSEPYGLTVAVTATGITTASATAITPAELLRLMYSVDAYYSEGAKVGFMMHRTTLGYLRTLDFSTATTHLFADLRIAGQQEMLMGYPVYINNDLPAMNGTTGLPVTATKHIYFGDFSKYVIRRIDGVAIERNDSVYWDKFTAGFMAWTRLDGNLITPNAIKPLLQA